MGNWLFATWLVILATFCIGSLIGDRQRARAMAALASRVGLKMWGDVVPAELTLDGTPMQQASSTWNVMDGKQNGVPVIAFDCKIGSGKYSWRRTVIAARSTRDVFAIVPSDSSYTVDRSGEWVILYAPKRGFSGWRPLMPIAELEARLSTLESGN